MFHAVDRSQLNTGTFVHDFNQGSARDKVRALDYYIVKTLLMDVQSSIPDMAIFYNLMHSAVADGNIFPENV